MQTEATWEGLMDYAPHERLVAPARAYAAVWRLGLGCAVGLGIFIALNYLYVGAAELVVGREFLAPIARNGGNIGPLQTLFLLSTFVLMFAAVGLTVYVVHKASPLSIVGALPRALRDFRTAFVALVPIILGVMAIQFVFEAPRLNVDLSLWMMLLPAAIGLVFVQVTAEEVVFRGYLQSQVAALGLPPAMWIMIPSILFGLGHYNPDAVGTAAPWIVLWAIMFGALAADLTARTGSIGAAVAFHFVNNLMAIVLIGLSDHMGGLALWVLPFSVSDTNEVMMRLPSNAIAMLVMYLVIRARLRV